MPEKWNTVVGVQFMRMEEKKKNAHRVRGFSRRKCREAVKVQKASYGKGGVPTTLKVDISLV